MHLCGFFAYNDQKCVFSRGNSSYNGGRNGEQSDRGTHEEQYEKIIKTMHEGGAGFRKNHRIATALVLEANLGLRIEDILELCPKDIVKDGNRYRLDIHEQKCTCISRTTALRTGLDRKIRSSP